MLAGDDADDVLGLGKSHTARTMLGKKGVHTPSPEVVLLSVLLIKINRKGKKQSRALLITDKAVYNLMPKKHGKCRRRIALKHVACVTVSSTSYEFVVHVPEEYDYRFKSSDARKIIQVMQDTIASCLNDNTGALTCQALVVREVPDEDLKAYTRTRPQSKKQTKEDVEKRKRELRAVATTSDEIKIHAGKKVVRQILDEKHKYGPDDFEFLKVLGRGSFGKVMQVKKRDDGKVFAMKVLKKKALEENNQVESTKAERRILERLRHPFLMKLRYAFQTEEKLYFILDYFQGGELFFHLKKVRRFSEDVARIYVAEIALALGHLHSLKVIYRDLKPENVLLDEKGHVCLTDFGLSKDSMPGSEQEGFCGTPEYLAPEVVAGQVHDKNIDWWSLGILLFELTVGLPPFYSRNINEMYDKIQNAVLKFPTYLSQHCKGLILGLLHRDPSRRLGSKDDIRELQAHPFFEGLDWNLLLRKEIDIAYKPDVKGVEDTTNFFDKFTAEPPIDSYVERSSLANAHSAFQNFTFDPSQGLLS